MLPQDARGVAQHLDALHLRAVRRGVVVKDTSDLAAPLTTNLINDLRRVPAATDERVLWRGATERGGHRLLRKDPHRLCVRNGIPQLHALGANVLHQLHQATARATHATGATCGGRVCDQLGELARCGMLEEHRGTQRKPIADRLLQLGQEPHRLDRGEAGADQ